MFTMKFSSCSRSCKEAITSRIERLTAHNALAMGKTCRPSGVVMRQKMGLRELWRWHRRVSRTCRSG